MKWNLFWQNLDPSVYDWCFWRMRMALSAGGEHSPLCVCLSQLYLKILNIHVPSHRKTGGKFCAGGSCRLPSYRIYIWDKKKSNNKAYLKVPGALISKFLCSADISNPFSWGEDKESIPPNVTKAGWTPANVNIGLSQIRGSCLRWT